jgi:hypothetical protein
MASNGIGSSGANELALALREGAGSRLESLNLDGNLVGGRGMRELARAFGAGACKDLRELHVRNNDVQSEVRHTLPRRNLNILACTSDGAIWSVCGVCVL